ncbi:unnamed protein product [Rangifer tarandus platyrhynchus]|uniref:Uncharacterized protein n=2 Tax=Rangifer tarandus platyrhynchus TaxID=3082113 RepID=A0AC59YY16_RANTA|nr:unnamed protein product [Rangifer tarandus platyrhynchus]
MQLPSHKLAAFLHLQLLPLSPYLGGELVFSSWCDDIGKSRERRAGWPPGTEALASRPPLRPAHLEIVLLASCPSGLHRYLIRPLPVSLPAPYCGSGGPWNLVPNDYVQIGDNGCCCCCFCCCS